MGEDGGRMGEDDKAAPPLVLQLQLATTLKYLVHNGYLLLVSNVSIAKPNEEVLQNLRLLG